MVEAGDENSASRTPSPPQADAERAPKVLKALEVVAEEDIAPAMLQMSPLLSTGSQGSGSGLSSPFDFSAYSSSIENVIKEKDDEIVKLKRMVR